MADSCGNPAADQDTFMPRKRRFDRSNKCIRCRESTGNIVIRHAVYCKNCLTPMLTHKFRRSLEPHVNPTDQRRSVLNPSGNLLIGLSGGLGSTVLLDMVYQSYYSEHGNLKNQHNSGKDYPRHKPWKNVFVCYVEVCEVYPEMRDRTSEVQELVKTYPEFEFIPLRLSHAFNQEWWKATGGASSSTDFVVALANDDIVLSPSLGPQTPLDSLKSYISSLPTQTSLHTTIQTFIRVLLLHTARYSGASHLLLGASLTSLAISLISSISQGGGFNVREEAQEEWTPSSAPEKTTIRIIRPLRDISTKECAAYAWWKDLTVIGKEKWPSTSQGIGSLTKEFIIGLEKDYPSTVSTITRTCAKLAPKDESGNTCVLCERPAQAGLREWISRISIRTFDGSENEPIAAGYSLVPLLCYACHTTLTSKSSRGMNGQPVATSPVLPVWTCSKLLVDDDADSEILEGKLLSPDQLRSTISDFLLE